MSEFDWIARYFAPLATGSGAVGLKDDVAELSGAADIITVDALVENVHFLPTDPLDTVARKLVRVNVSDLISKGARPDEALLTLGWSKMRSEEELARFAVALGEELAAFGAHLIGGDTVMSAGGLFLSLTLTGRSTAPRAPVRRSGAQAGDLICATGEIGAGVLGLKAAKANQAGQAQTRYQVPAIPDLAFADLIARYATASMDVSDGLIGDLEKLLTASACGGTLWLDKVCYFSTPSDLKEALEQATGGDDYQCLFTLAPSDVDALRPEAGDVSVSVVGEVGGGGGTGLELFWHGNPVEMPKRAGFHHA